MSIEQYMGQCRIVAQRSRYLPLLTPAHWRVKRKREKNGRCLATSQ
jgi:hypothetical protein